MTQEFFVDQPVVYAHTGQIGVVKSIMTAGGMTSGMYVVQFANGVNERVRGNSLMTFAQYANTLGKPATMQMTKDIRAAAPTNRFRVMQITDGACTTSELMSEDDAVAEGKKAMLNGSAQDVRLLQEIASFETPVRTVDVRYY